MYSLLLLIVLVSLDGSAAQDSLTISTQIPNNETSQYVSTSQSTLASVTTITSTATEIRSKSTIKGGQCCQPATSAEETSLFNIKINKDCLFILLIAILSLFCILIMTTVALLCKSRGSLVTLEQVNLTKRNAVDAGPSETVHFINDNQETPEAEKEEQDPQEMERETAEANHMSTVGTDTPAPETTPAPEPEFAPPPAPDMSEEIV